MRTKIILGTIKKNKIRFSLCIVSMAFAIALLFSSLSIIGTLLVSYEKAEKIFFGNSDIKISLDSSSMDAYFNIDELNFQHKDNIQYIMDVPTASGAYNKDDALEKLMIRGITVNEAKELELFSEISNLQSSDFMGNKIIISECFANEYNYKIADKISINILGDKYDYEIWGIYKGDNAFSETAYKSMMLLPKNTVKELLHYDSKKTNFALVHVKEADEIKNTIEEINTSITNIKAEAVFMEEDFYEKMQGVFIVFIITSVVITIMCLVIVYQTFRVIMHDRERTFGIVRCLGATKRYINGLAMQEGMIYGTLGGICGGILGIAITKFIGHILKPDTLNSDYFIISITTLIVVIVFPILLCICLSLLAVKSYSDYKIKELLINTLKNKEKKVSKLRVILSAILFVVAIGGIFIMPDSMPGIFIILFIILSFISFIGLLPGIITLLLKTTKKIYGFIKKDNIYLVINYLQKSHFFISSCTIIVISVSAILMINSALSSVMNNFSTITSDFYLCNYYVDNIYDMESEKNELELLSGVKSTYDYISIEDVKVDGADRNIYVVDGANKDYFKFFSFNISEQLKETLNGGRNILLSNSLKENLNVNVDDELTLFINEKPCKYIVRGFFETSYNNGYYAFVSKEALLSDLNLESGTVLYINTSKENNDMLNEIRNVIESYGGNVTSTKTLVKNELDPYEKMMSAIRLVSWLPLFVSIIVLISNSILGFYDKKRIIAIYRSVGMNISSARNMILCEQITSGLLCGGLGIILGNILIFQLKAFLNHMNNTMSVQYSFGLSLIMILIVVIVYFVPFITYSGRALKFNLASVLKQE